jgi:hypothetical protein
MHFDLSSNSQIFGKMLRDAGYEGLIYPSVRGTGTCLAIFVENFRNSTSFIEVSNPVPPYVKNSRLDQANYQKFYVEA